MNATIEIDGQQYPPIPIKSNQLTGPGEIPVEYYEAIDSIIWHHLTDETLPRSWRMMPLVGYLHTGETYNITMNR